MRVRLPLADKVALASILSLGVIIMLFAIIRIVVTNQNNSHPETSWLNLWSQIEASVAVIISALAPFKTLFTRQKKTASYGNSNSTPWQKVQTGNTTPGQLGRSTSQMGIPLNDRNHTYAEHGTIGVVGRADSTGRILGPPHIMKRVDIEQSAY